jgi:hypothetical protein
VDVGVDAGARHKTAFADAADRRRPIPVPSPETRRAQAGVEGEKGGHEHTRPASTLYRRGSSSPRLHPSLATHHNSSSPSFSTPALRPPSPSSRDCARWTSSRVSCPCPRPDYCQVPTRVYRHHTPSSGPSCFSRVNHSTRTRLSTSPLLPSYHYFFSLHWLCFLALSRTRCRISHQHNVDSVPLTCPRKGRPHIQVLPHPSHSTRT